MNARIAKLYNKVFSTPQGSRELYRRYSDRYKKEREAERKSRFTENTFKNKPDSFR